MRPRLLASAAPLALLALFALFACGGATDEPPVAATDAEAFTLAGSEVLEVSSSGGMPVYCAGAPTAPWLDYRVDLSARTLRFDSGGHCAGPDGGIAPQSEQDIALSAADRDALLALTRALTLETVKGCGADAPTRRVTVTHADGTSEQHIVNDGYQNECRLGQREIAPGSFGALEAKLSALLVP
jgi:predicted small lipoprotein YifL